MIDTLERGRDAMRRHAWPEALEALEAADGAGALSPEDLELLDNAFWWSGRPDEATEAFERAFRAYSDAGQPVDAARAALELTYRAFRSLNAPVGGGWLARAGHPLADVPESHSHAWLGVFQAFGALVASQLELRAASDIFCTTIAACRNIGDLVEWR